MSVVVRFGDRLRSLGAFLEDEIQGIVAGYNALIGVQHKLHTGQHGDITCDSVDSNTTIPIKILAGLRLQYGPLEIGTDLLSTTNPANGLVLVSPSSNQNDFNPSGIDTAVFLGLSPSASIDITGIKTRSIPANRLLWIHNYTNVGNNITLKHESSSSSGNNRILCPDSSDYIIRASESACLLYRADGGFRRWVVIGTSRRTALGCRISRTADKTLTTATSTAIDFDSEVWDTGGMHDNSTNNTRISITSTTGPGKFHFWANATFAASATGERQLEILYNGATIIGHVNRGVNSATVDETLQCTVGEYICSVGDYVEVRAYQNSGGNLAIKTGGGYSIQAGAHFIGS